MNIGGATIINAQFVTYSGSTNPKYAAINGTFKNCVFYGVNGLSAAEAGETVVFEDCLFDGSVYGVHFDCGANDVIFKRCTFSGFNTFGSELTLLTLEDCTFVGNGASAYNGINMWGNTELTRCTFVFDGSTANEWVDLCDSNQTVTFTDCVVTDGVNETPIEDVVGNYGDNNTIIIDGVTVAIPNMS